MTLSIINDALGRSRTRKVRDIEDMAEVMAATQRVVDTLTPPAGGRYIVALKDAETASTDYRAHRIVITAKPLFDSSLTQAEVAEVLTGLTAHEIGHTIFDAHEAEAVRAHNPHPAYHKCHNVLSDHRLETRMRARFPIIGPTFTTVGRWVAKFYRYGDKRAVVATPTMTSLERFNFMVAAVRYPTGVRWSADPLTRAERRRWREWADRYIADDSLDLHLAGCDEAFAWLMEAKTPEPEPEDESGEDEDEGGDEGEPLGDGSDESDEDDEDEDGYDEDDTDEGGWTDEWPTGDMDDEDEDGEGKGSPTDEDEDGEDGEEPTDGSGSGEDGEDESDTDESGERPGGTSDEPPAGWDDESDPVEDDGSATEGEDDGPGESHDNGWGVGGGSWNAPDIHESVEREYNQSALGERINRFNDRTKVTFGVFGSMTAQWS
jgi:hypothetical protein